MIFPRKIRVLLLLLSQLLSLALIVRGGLLSVELGAPWLIPLGLLLGHIGVDAVTWITHWTLDNHFTPRTPIIGNTVYWFRQHHVEPLAMFQRDFIDNNVEQAVLCFFFSVPALVVAAGAGGAAAAVACLFFGWGTFVGAWITTIHKYAHVDKPPAFFSFCQRLHLLVDAEHHAIHHRGGRGHYGLAAGWIDVVVEGVEKLRK